MRWCGCDNIEAPAELGGDDDSAVIALLGSMNPAATDDAVDVGSMDGNRCGEAEAKAWALG